MEAALFFLLAAGGSALASYDAAAYEAAAATDPASTRNPDSYADYFQRFVFSNGDDYSQAVVSFLDVDPDADLFWSTYASRTRVIQAALSAALELARQADAALDTEIAAQRAEAQAEQERQQEARQALWAALEELARGSEPYTAFKRSFQESCE